LKRHNAKSNTIKRETDFNMLKKSPYICLAFALTLSACGGGGSSSSSGGGSSTPTTPSTPEPTGADFSLSPVDYTVAGLDTMDSMIQLGNITNNMLKQPRGNATEISNICENGGISTATYSSGSTTFTSGDVVTFSFNDCFHKEIGGDLSGDITAEITSVDINQGAMTYDASFNQLETIVNDGRLFISGDFTVQSISTLPLDSFTLSISDPFSISQPDGFEILLDDFQLTHTRDWLTAKYSLDGHGQFLESNVFDAFAFSVDEPIVGYFSEYPHEGKVTLSSDVSSDLVITTNFVTDSDMYNFEFAGDTGAMDWSFSVDGAMWSASTEVGYFGYATHHRADNFHYLGINTGPHTINNYPILESLEFQFSRPIASIGTQTTKLYSVWSNNPDVEVTADVVGAKVILTPTSPLTPGVEYTLYGFEVFDALGQSISTDSVTLTASTAAIAEIETSDNFYSRDSQPSLSVFSNFANGGETVSVQWSEITDYGVTFSDDGGSEIYVDISAIPSDVNEVTVMAEAISDNGLIAFATKTLLIVPDTGSYLAFKSEEGDYIGAGQSVIMDDTDSVFSVQTYSTQEIEARVDSSFFSDYWSLNLEAPEGSELEVGTYNDATRWPFQAALVPGLDFSGNHRGCNNLYGSFTISEIAFSDGQLTKLAVDFVQYCESTDNPPLFGILRFNSTAKIL
jgi:hypothetical protein